MQRPVDLRDASARLKWAERLGDRLMELSQHVLASTAANGLEYDERVQDGLRFVRFRIALSDPVPEEAGFLLSDLVVNARSSLDMALQAVVDGLGLDWKKPQYPLEDERPMRGCTRAERRLPEPYLEAVLGMQPFKPHGFDIPVNLTAIELRDLSNINKHRRITPVIRRISSRGFTHAGPSSSLIQIDETRWDEWPAEGQVVTVLRAPESVPLEAFLETRPSAGLYLKVEVGRDGGYEFGPEDRLPINVIEFTPRVLAYVRLAISRIEQAANPEATAALRFSFDARL